MDPDPNDLYANRAMKSILVVDDDTNIRNLISEVLREEGIPHVLASSGSEAVEHHLDPGDHALVLTDLMMPEGDGLDVLRAFADKNPDLPVIVMSALMDETEIVNEVEGEPNVVGWLKKPLDIDRLRELIARVLGG